MSSLVDILMQSVGSNAVEQISKKVGANPAVTGMVVQTAVPLLLSALAKNSSTPSGAQALQQALNNDHDGSILDDVMGFLGGSGTGSGAGILRHVLGGQQAAVQSSLGKSTGLDGQAIGQILELVAPLVMGALGRTTQQQGLNASSLSQFLSGQQQQAQQNAPDLLGALTGLLDANKDGSIIDDVAGMVGKLFKGR